MPGRAGNYPASAADGSCAGWRRRSSQARRAARDDTPADLGAVKMVVPGAEIGLVRLACGLHKCSVLKTEYQLIAAAIPTASPPHAQVWALEYLRVTFKKKWLGC